MLGLIVAEILYEQNGEETEGRMAHRLNALVDGNSCASIARALGLPAMLRLGKQARDDGARESTNVLGDAMEAIIGALFVDKGFDKARTFVRTHWGPMIDSQAEAPKHPKSALQEWAAKHRRGVPLYELKAQSGPAHDRVFEVTVSLKGMETVSAVGNSKQEAETRAARLFMERHG